MKKIGIWLDKEKAHIVTLENDKETMLTLYSEVEDYHITGNRFLGGSQEIAPDKKYLERERNQLKAYFKDIVIHLQDVDAIAIFGPAETNEKFRKELQKKYKNINAKVKGVTKADSMTENQVKALVKDFFKQ